MTSLEQAARQALEALNIQTPLEQREFELRNLAIEALRQALEQPKREPVSHTVVAGALFDFMGWLTTRNERLILSFTDDASSAAEAIKEFAKMRCLSLDGARVQDWQNMTDE